MDKLVSLMARHPIDKKPYNAIRLIEFDHNRTAIYGVSGSTSSGNAATALRIAFERHGAPCFYCDAWMHPRASVADFTRDHLRPVSKQGGNQLHNLVFACRDCNSRKSDEDVTVFKAERAADYLKSVDLHLGRCLAEMGRRYGWLAV